MFEHPQQPAKQIFKELCKHPTPLHEAEEPIYLHTSIMGYMDQVYEQ